MVMGNASVYITVTNECKTVLHITSMYDIFEDTLIILIVFHDNTIIMKMAMIWTWDEANNDKGLVIIKSLKKKLVSVGRKEKYIYLIQLYLIQCLYNSCNILELI
jgi:hypothetical protein